MRLYPIGYLQRGQPIGTTAFACYVYAVNRADESCNDASVCSVCALVPKPASHSTRGSRVAVQPDGDDDGNGAAAVATTCERLQTALALVDDRMRAGYSAKESARLWERWREARSQLREARC